jgi:hypothetical protein
MPRADGAHAKSDPAGLVQSGRAPRRGGLNVGLEGQTAEMDQASFAAIDSISETS